MYEQYYGLAQSPFTLSPDPRFLYLSASHDDALRALLQALRRREGFIVLAGDIGTGKTTLCRALVEQLDGATFTSLVRDPFVTVEELLRDVLLDFGIVSRETARNGRLGVASRHDLIATLHDFLRSLVPLNGSCVLIIDEAQHLATDVLEQIRVIANLETNQSKLLQIVLVGQLDLLDTLAGADMRQLAQRVSVRARLQPLTRVDVAGYVAHRLSVAGEQTSVAFAPAALDAIHRISGGVPRVINLLCDRALALGATRATPSIDAGTIRHAAVALGLTIPDAPPVATVTADAAVANVGVDRGALARVAAVPAPVVDDELAPVMAGGAGRGRPVVLAIGVAIILLLITGAALLGSYRVMPPPAPDAPRFTLRLPAPIEPLPIPEPPPTPVRRRLVPVEPSAPPVTLPAPPPGLPPA